MPAPTSSNAPATINATMSNETANPAATSKVANNFPPSKTDKPRPHICNTCQRSFARLEHLKRHERSHTKEKPFECPECARCFARRDLLLRHQQKLHLTTTPASRPRNRRESASSAATGASSRVRKSSAANANTAASSMRPRANTISHVDGEALQNMMTSNQFTLNKRGSTAHRRHPSLVGLPLQGDFQMGGMANVLGQRGVNGVPPKLETNGFGSAGLGASLRTAPAMGGYRQDLGFEKMLFAGSTINPNALHYTDSPQAMAVDSASSYQHAFPDMTASQSLDENFDWMSGFENHLNFGGANENAIDGSSPSAISTASQSGISDGVMLDGSNNPSTTSSALWQQSMMAPPMMTQNPYALDMSTSSFPDLFNQGSMSPHGGSLRNPNDPYFSTPPPSMSSLSPSMMPVLITQELPQGRNFTPETPSSMNSNGHVAMALSTITESTRQALLVAMAQSTPLGTRKYSFPPASSPLSPLFSGQVKGMGEGSRGLPSTTDLQRYVGAYLQYFHPHLPFLHLPTLSFHITPATGGSSRPYTLIGGNGCLILSMAAIGALYELEQAPAKDLFEASRMIMKLFLEERRKEDVGREEMRKKGLATHADTTLPHASHTPLWLVQAMLLNVVFGFNCGDRISGEIASNHCVALIGIAKSADLLQPQTASNLTHHDSHMTDDELSSDPWNCLKHERPDLYAEWHEWKTHEERKRTLYGVFILSSLLVAAYNHSPTLTNSDIHLYLPCDEEFWTADSAATFKAMGGAEMAERGQLTFPYALGELLCSSERQSHQPAGLPCRSRANVSDLPQSSIQPSTFGCLVLINALHNYIWETRQRHHHQIWTNEETEKMHRHIEPALNAWQAAWASNPNHSLERPNPHGYGPLSADSIPLLDLAYVRLFVNLGRSKEKFWQRDYNGMAEELARGSEIIQHAEHSPGPNVDPGSESPDASGPGESFGGFGSFGSFGSFASSSHTSSLPDFTQPSEMTPHHADQRATTTSKRERHLRKAAFYAADSLSMSDKLGVTFADFTSRELPLQSAMCAFDCAQVLAEWVATVQERVGRYIGILGKDDIDVTQMPAIMLLEEEDCKLLGKIQEVLHSAEIKINFELSGMNAMAMPASQLLPTMDDSGYGAKILRITAYMLDKAAVWPVTNLMAQALETQANHMHGRAENSALHRE